MDVTLWPLLVLYSPSRYIVCNLIQDKLMLLLTTTGASVKSIIVILM